MMIQLYIFDQIKEGHKLKWLSNNASLLLSVRRDCWKVSLSLKTFTFKWRIYDQVKTRRNSRTVWSHASASAARKRKVSLKAICVQASLCWIIYQASSWLMVELSCKSCEESMQWQKVVLKEDSNFACLSIIKLTTLLEPFSKKISRPSRTQSRFYPSPL